MAIFFLAGVDRRGTSIQKREGVGRVAVCELLLPDPRFSGRTKAVSALSNAQIRDVIENKMGYFSAAKCVMCEWAIHPGGWGHTYAIDF